MQAGGTAAWFPSRSGGNLKEGGKTCPTFDLPQKLSCCEHCVGEGLGVRAAKARRQHATLPTSAAARAGARRCEPRSRSDAQARHDSPAPAKT
jgi:hypothetical protein